MKIRRGSLDGGGVNDSGVHENGYAQTYPSKFTTLNLTLFDSNTQFLVGFSVIPKRVTLNDL